MATSKKGSTGNLVQGQPGGWRDMASFEDDIFISAEEVARRLDIPLSTFYGWRYKGIGPRGYRLGRNLRYWWADVLAWIHEQVDDPEDQLSR